MTKWQGCIKFLHLVQNLLAPVSIVSYNIRPLFLELSWESHDFIVSNCNGHKGIGLWTSDKDPDVMGLVLTIASTSASNVRRDSSFRFVPCILSSATEIEWADLIWRFHTRPILLVVVGFPFHWIHWPPYSFINSLIFLRFIS